MISGEDIARQRNQIMTIAARYGASNLRLFGSVARGEQTQDSDVDLLINMAKGRSLLDHVALMQDLQDLLNCRVDVVDEQDLHPRLRDRILMEAVAL